MLTTLRFKWKVYTAEAICLGLFMLSASCFATLLEYQNSPVRLAISNSFIRLCLMGFAMGITASLIIYSPLQKISGAHMNPAVSFSFVRLKKLSVTDAVFYFIFQSVGGSVAVFLVYLTLGHAFRDPNVNYVATVPGRLGVPMAFLFECCMSFGMMLMVLTTSNHPRLAKYTGLIAGFLVASFVVLSAPISGFSINPARTIASAVVANQYPSFWIYMTAPFIGMLAASEFFIYHGRRISKKTKH